MPNDEINKRNVANNPISLSPRLMQIAKMVKPNSVVADIGTDHAWLPIFLCYNNIATRCFACDVAVLPLEIAKQNIAEQNIKNITPVLSDGLISLPLNEIDCFVVAGMGGETIVEILKNSLDLIKIGTNFIFQPMTKCEILLTFLVANGFSVEKTKAVAEGERLYIIIKTIYKKTIKKTYYPSFPYIGDLHLGDEVDRKYCQNVLKRLEKRGKLQKNLDNEMLQELHIIIDDLRDKINKAIFQM